MGFSDLIREVNTQGLLSNDWPPRWEAGEMRGSTSHAYDERVVLKVGSEIPALLNEAKFFAE